MLNIFPNKDHHTEAATGGVLLVKVFLEIWQNSHENTCARVSFLIKLQALRKRCSENMQQICRGTPMAKCDFNKVAKQGEKLKKRL